MSELEKLITLMLEDRLSETERERLAVLLESDSEARELYAAQCQMHAQMSDNPALRPLLKAEEPIGVEPEEGAPRTGSKAIARSRFRSQIGLMAASVAISAVGILSVLHFSRDTETEFRVAAEDTVSPEKAYEQAAFSEAGSLKRPPTNFAVITPDVAKGMAVSFNRDIRPILSDNCFHCHGPDAASRKADLRLDIEASAFLPHGKFEAPIVKGNAEESPLYQRIMSPLRSEMMPPPDSHRSLDEREKALIGEWINQGAEWEGHWAFSKPEKVSPPDSSWGNGPIDAFISAKQGEQGLAPNGEADRATLARRLALDLTGLPPSHERVNAFVNDSAADAYEKFVDSLLADPAYGEHQARYWLDAARYADTHGLHLDNYREIWPYRDWVIKAFNENLPFDIFTVEQIAGDLLPGAGEEQLLATGFNRCNPTTSEGGAIDEEYRAIYAKDRVETTSTVYLGLTMGCASCHDHKFDPLSQKDFYQFSAFFNNIDGPIMDGNAYDTKPNLVMPKPEHLAEWGDVSKAHDDISKRIEEAKKNRKSEYESWLQAETVDIEDLGPKADIAVRFAEDKKDDKDADEEREDEEEDLAGPDKIEDFEVALNEMSVERPFMLEFEYRLGRMVAGEERLIVSKFDGDRGFRLYEMHGDEALPDRYRFRIELIHSLRSGNMISVTTRSTRYGSLRPNFKSRFTVSYDGSKKAGGILVGVPGRLTLEEESLIDALDGDFSSEAPLAFGDDEPERPGKNGLLQIGYFGRDVPFFLSEYKSKGKQLKEILAKPAEERSKRDNNTLQGYYFDIVDEEVRALRIEQASLKREYEYIYDMATVSLVMKEKEEEPHAYMLSRGEYDAKGEKVFPELPSTLGGLPEDLPRNRLGLAQWLVGEENPLTARVTVNRVWQNLFGIGIVRTSEDFGIMGENPTHPELLDWLAVAFVESGWDYKAMIKKMVMSETYRQDSRISKKAFEIDPENRFLARGPRYRLDAEAIRDKALAVSGLLSEKRGGPPVRPYQPKGIWNAVAYSGSDTRFYVEDEGENLYRRSLYTFWKRTAPPASMSIFDAPSRENCSVRRERTNTPLQALTLMNDPQYVEAARHLAQRALSDEGDEVGDQIGAMYRFAFGQDAPEKYSEILLRSYRKFEDDFRGSPEDASKLIQVGDSPTAADTEDVVGFASLTMVASQIMNLDSFINKY